MIGNRDKHTTNLLLLCRFVVKEKLEKSYENTQKGWVGQTLGIMKGSQRDWASQMALVVKNLPAKAGDIRDMGLVPGLEDFLEEGMATHSSILAWKIPMDRGAWWATVHGLTNSQT